MKAMATMKADAKAKAAKNKKVMKAMKAMKATQAAKATKTGTSTTLTKKKGASPNKETKRDGIEWHLELLPTRTGGWTFHTFTYGKKKCKVLVGSDRSVLSSVESATHHSPWRVFGI